MTTDTLETERPPTAPRSHRLRDLLWSVLALVLTASIAYGAGTANRPGPPPVTVIVKCPVVGDHVVQLSGGTRDATVRCPR